jgi:hypothetical protein
MMAVRSVGDYELWQDTLYGVSRWCRVSDGALTDMQTGQDSEDEVEHALDSSDEHFVDFGAQQSYDPRASRNTG